MTPSGKMVTMAARNAATLLRLIAIDDERNLARVGRPRKRPDPRLGPTPIIPARVPAAAPDLLPTAYRLLPVS
jgi:hypothetical protein